MTPADLEARRQNAAQTTLDKLAATTSLDLLGLTNALPKVVGRLLLAETRMEGRRIIVTYTTDDPHGALRAEREAQRPA